MKFIVSILLTAFLAFAICLFLPWWSFAITSFIVAVAIPQKPWNAFAAGFLALFLFWGIYAFAIDAANAHLLSVKIAEILPLRGSYILLLLITGLVGGLIAGFAAITGSFLLKKQPH
jgi:hypothetical protein